MSNQVSRISVDRSPSVLIVDDDRTLGAGLSMALGLDGLDAMHVPGGTQALALLAEGLRPRVIILDVTMPDMDGWQVLESIRTNALTTSIPVIMLTARDDVASKVQGFDLGADDYLTKPFAIKELRCRVRALLKRADPDLDQAGATIAVLTPGGGHEFIAARDVFFIEGIRNYTYVHTYDRRFLCNSSLGLIGDRGLPGFVRPHRSHIVNLDKVVWCGWATRSTFRLRLSNADASELPVSRNLAVDLQRKLGMR